MVDQCTFFVCLMVALEDIEPDFSERCREKMRSNRHSLQEGKLDISVHNIPDQSLKQVVQKGWVISSLEDMPNITG